MAIARKPGNPQAPAQRDAAAEKFIAGAGIAVQPPAKPEEPPVEEGGRRPAMVRFDRGLLKRIDDAAKRRGVSRSAWIQFTLSKALDEEGHKG